MEHTLRIITAILGISFLFFLYYFLGQRGLEIITFFIAIISYYEFLNILLHEQNTWKSRKLKTSASLILAAIFFICTQWSYGLILLSLACALLYWILNAIVKPLNELKATLHDVLVQSFGFFYIIGSLSFLPAITHFDAGNIYLLNLILIIWAGDTFAYYGGKAWGKKKLSPLISPGKTWIGAYSGIAGAIFVCVVIKYYFHLDVSLKHWMGIAILTEVLAQIGDLFESLIKRSAGVKDSGILLPGHGGMFDRFDSLILATPFYYFLLLLFS